MNEVPLIVWFVCLFWFFHFSSKCFKSLSNTPRLWVSETSIKDVFFNNMGNDDGEWGCWRKTLANVPFSKGTGLEKNKHGWWWPGNGFPLTYPCACSFSRLCITPGVIILQSGNHSSSEHSRIEFLSSLF